MKSLLFIIHIIDNNTMYEHVVFAQYKDEYLNDKVLNNIYIYIYIKYILLHIIKCHVH